MPNICEKSQEMAKSGIELSVPQMSEAPMETEAPVSEIPLEQQTTERLALNPLPLAKDGNSHGTADRPMEVGTPVSDLPSEQPGPSSNDVITRNSDQTELDSSLVEIKKIEEMVPPGERYKRKFRNEPNGDTSLPSKKRKRKSASPKKKKSSLSDPKRVQPRAKAELREIAPKRRKEDFEMIFAVRTLIRPTNEVVERCPPIPQAFEPPLPSSPEAISSPQVRNCSTINYLH